ncbi:hypothetical protein CANCADRAFT_31386 [Tortispora caseinolytica NRRL Y-17796]|uniref:Fcf2 pre-rRNA processing C-terminal domain-containing protein n=1 Tax=Tortispora caseinolytica NRRL Y-17796 TaxID=767744 RepID=A0A1E4TFC1_9ASCO|nr:hypothetical protein CANCADRAFT_31386 [Tortispora caseinolytica NRRL Y-17796]
MNNNIIELLRKAEESLDSKPSLKGDISDIKLPALRSTINSDAHVSEQVAQSYSIRKVRDPLVEKKLSQKARSETTGAKWFDMKKPEMTPEIERDLKILKMRSVLDPKRHYKREDSKKIPEFFQSGTIIEGPTEFFSSRLTKKERHKTLAQELLSSEDARKYFSKKYKEIQSKRRHVRKYSKQSKKRA